jgi:hypothetical protein
MQFTPQISGRRWPIYGRYTADIWPIYLDIDRIGRYSGRYMADKHSIALLLSQRAGRWNSPAEIKTEIADVPDRTLRRWLGELVHEGVIECSGSRKGTRYRWKPTVLGRYRPRPPAPTAQCRRAPAVMRRSASDLPVSLSNPSRTETNHLCCCSVTFFCVSLGHEPASSDLRTYEQHQA